MEPVILPFQPFGGNPGKQDASSSRLRQWPILFRSHRSLGYALRGDKRAIFFANFAVKKDVPPWRENFNSEQTEPVSGDTAFSVSHRSFHSGLCKLLSAETVFSRLADFLILLMC